MANFCVSCGNPVNPGAGFCQSCGARVGQAAAPAAPIPQVQQPVPPPVIAAQPGAPPPPVNKSGSALKVILVAVFLFCAVGIAGVVGLYYYAKHKVQEKVAELKATTGVDLPAAIHTAANSPAAVARRGDPCALLSASEAQQIIGMNIVKAVANEGGTSDEACSYYADPEASKAAADTDREKFRDLQNAKGSSPGDIKQVEDLVKSIGASANDGSTPILQITVFRGNGKMATAAFNIGSGLMGVKAERPTGPWDEAAFGPMNSTLTFRKGENGAMIDLRQIAQGHDRGLELAKLIASRL